MSLSRLLSFFPRPALGAVYPATTLVSSFSQTSTLFSRTFASQGFGVTPLAAATVQSSEKTIQKYIQWTQDEYNKLGLNREQQALAAFVMHVSGQRRTGNPVNDLKNCFVFADDNEVSAKERRIKSLKAELSALVLRIEKLDQIAEIKLANENPYDRYKPIPRPYISNLEQAQSRARKIESEIEKLTLEIKNGPLSEYHFKNRSLAQRQIMSCRLDPETGKLIPSPCKPTFGLYKTKMLEIKEQLGLDKLEQKQDQKLNLK